MIKNLEIKNFKSIKHIKIEPKKINVFIGEPNTGKSNILEAFGLLSGLRYNPLDLKGFVRFGRIIDLFMDQSIANALSIDWDDYSLTGSFEYSSCKLKMISPSEGTYNWSYNMEGKFDGSNFSTPPMFDQFKYYNFKTLDKFVNNEVSFLIPPYGENLCSLANSNPEIAEIMSLRFREIGYDVSLKPYENKIEILKRKQSVYISIPYHLSSDSFQRIAFYMAAMESNTDSILTFEEPESNVFPFYVANLAESIGMDSNNNQYFIATHNPYFLMSLLEKSPKGHVSVYVSSFDENETTITCLTDNQLDEVRELEHSVFHNLDRFLIKDSVK
jgi:AAA15 family ATPase/GTPase